MPTRPAVNDLVAENVCCWSVGSLSQYHSPTMRPLRVTIRQVLPEDSASLTSVASASSSMPISAGSAVSHSAAGNTSSASARGGRRWWSASLPWSMSS